MAPTKKSIGETVPSETPLADNFFKSIQTSNPSVMSNLLQSEESLSSLVRAWLLQSGLSAVRDNSEQAAVRIEKILRKSKALLAMKEFEIVKNKDPSEVHGKNIENLKRQTAAKIEAVLSKYYVL